jgi:phosphoribosylformylglycinamidine synthase subunit PurQ / glutaminase
MPDLRPAQPVRSSAHALTRALILRAAGTNCEAETAHALELVGAQPDVVHLNQLARSPKLLEQARILVIPGGFSFGDNVAAGRIFAARLRQELRGPLEAHVARGGFVIGICNGFQVLSELGLLEGFPQSNEARTIALIDNSSNHYECRWVHLRSEPCAASWLPRGIWPCPVAHGEGRLALAAGALERLEARGQVALRYVTADGRTPQYPELPNGSTAAIAGLCDPTGRVLGLMPHPERNVAPWHHPTWTRLPARSEGEGLSFFRGLLAAARA